jgi:hypothetical protein
MAIRRLPVIQAPSGDDAEAASRPAWHWVLIGSGFVVTLFLPLALLALAVARSSFAARWGTLPTLTGAAAGGSLALASALAGYLVARFGFRGARTAALAGGLGALELWGLVLLGGGFGSIFEGLILAATLIPLGAGFCALGARARGGRGH